MFRIHLWMNMKQNSVVKTSTQTSLIHGYVILGEIIILIREERRKGQIKQRKDNHKNRDCNTLGISCEKIVMTTSHIFTK